MSVSDMTRRQREVMIREVNNENITVKELESIYRQALQDCSDKIAELSARKDLENINSIIYQKKYQEAIKGQLEKILDNMGRNQYSTVVDYLNNCYADGFIGNMYDLAGQGIPLIVPINQNQVVKAINTDSKLSKGLYRNLGEDVEYLKRAVRAQVSRGLAAGSSWREVAKELTRSFRCTPFNGAYKRAIRIVRTEGHRIQNAARLDCMRIAESKGADILKQWDSTLDGRVRETHRQLDGQIRELNEMFDSPNGGKAIAPGYFNDPAEDCNCRCAMLQRARWALNEDELETLQERAEYFGLDKTDDFDDFKDKYLETSDEIAKDRFGLFSNNNKSDPKYFDYKGKDIDTVESELGNLDYEVGVIFDKNGEAISCQLGKEDEIRFTKHQCRIMKGNDVTHNHPLNTPPSPEDLYLLVKYEANSFRTCGKNGVYVIEYSEKVADLPEFKVFSHKYDDVLETLQPKYQEKVKNGMVAEEALIQMGEETWDKLFDIYGIKPRFESR